VENSTTTAVMTRSTKVSAKYAMVGVKSASARPANKRTTTTMMDPGCGVYFLPSSA